jgi:hypothetical protein
LLPRTLDAGKAREIVTLVKKLRGPSSFRNLLKESARVGIVRDNKTLRVYLDLLIAGGVLSVRRRDVGSVYRQEIYSVRSVKPRVWVGLGILGRHGLNWDVPITDMRAISTDFEALVRSKEFENGRMASLEDSLIDELHTDAKKTTGTTFLVVAMITTTKVDLPYLIRRADQTGVGKATRILFRRILEITSSDHTELNAATFFVVRDRFLRIARQYAQTGFWNLVENELGIGDLGVPIAKNLTESEVIGSAGKQLGVTG